MCVGEDGRLGRRIRVTGYRLCLCVMKMIWWGGVTGVVSVRLGGMVVW